MTYHFDFRGISKTISERALFQNSLKPTLNIVSSFSLGAFMQNSLFKDLQPSKKKQQQIDAAWNNSSGRELDMLT